MLAGPWENEVPYRLYLFDLERREVLWALDGKTVACWPAEED